MSAKRKSAEPLSVSYLVLAMSSIQVGAALARGIFPLVGAVGTSLLRLFLASLVLWVVWRPWRYKMSRKQFKAVCQYGVALGMMNLTFYQAIELIPLGIAVALEFTGPLAVALLSSRKAIDFVWAGFAAAGIFLIGLGSTALENISSRSTHGLSPLGIFFALVAAFFWAMYIILGNRVAAQGDSPADGGITTAWGMLVATLVVLPPSLIEGGVFKTSPEILPRALAVAILSGALPYTLEMFALKKLPVKTFGILMSLEPALGALSGVIFLAEYLTWTQYLAIVFVMIASVGSSLSARRQSELVHD